MRHVDGFDRLVRTKIFHTPGADARKARAEILLTAFPVTEE